MDISAIGSASIQMSLAKTQQSVQIATLKGAMEMQTVAMETLVNDMLPQQSFGQLLDVRA